MLKMHLIHLTCRTSFMFSLTYLKLIQNTYISLQLGNRLTQSLFYNEVLNISYNLWNTILKVKHRMFHSYRMAANISAMPLVIPQMSGNCSPVILPTLTREYPTIYFQPGKRPKFKIQSTISPKRLFLSHHSKVEKE